MMKLFRGLILLPVAFAFSQVQAMTTKLDCRNDSSTAMKLTIGSASYTVSAKTNKFDLSIPASVTAIQIRPSNTSYVGVPNFINIPKASLNVANDDKYDVLIQATLTGASLKVTILSDGEKVGEGTFKMA